MTNEMKTSYLQKLVQDIESHFSGTVPTSDDLIMATCEMVDPHMNIYEAVDYVSARVTHKMKI